MYKITLLKNVNYGVSDRFRKSGFVFKVEKLEDLPKAVYTSVCNARLQKSNKTYIIEEIKEKGTPIASKKEKNTIEKTEIKKIEEPEETEPKSVKKLTKKTIKKPAKK